MSPQSKAPFIFLVIVVTIILTVLIVAPKANAVGGVPGKSYCNVSLFPSVIKPSGSCPYGYLVSGIDLDGKQMSCVRISVECSR